MNTGKYIADFPDSVLSFYQTQRQVAPTRFHLTEVLINGILCKLAQAHQARERAVLEAFKKKATDDIYHVDMLIFIVLAYYKL